MGSGGSFFSGAVSSFLGTSYAVGSQVGNCKVVKAGAGYNFTAEGLSANKGVAWLYRLNKARQAGKAMQLLHRGTTFISEIEIVEETGYVMSDVARAAYKEAQYVGKTMEESIEFAMQASQEAHAANLAEYGSMEAYAAAHSASAAADVPIVNRTLISFTTNIDKAANTFGKGGKVFSVLNKVASGFQVATGGESEVLISHMIKVK